MSKLSGSYFGWFTAMVSFAVLIAFSSCSTTKEASLAYMDDIYKPYDANFLIAVMKDKDGVSDQDASVIKPYRPTVPDYYPYVQPLNFNMAFSFANYGPSYFWGYGNSCFQYGLNGYDVRYYRYGCYPRAWYSLPYYMPGYGYYPYNYGYRNDYNNPGGGGSFIYGNNVNYFHGVNSSERYKGSNGVHYSKYVYYRASGSSGVLNTGRQSGSSGKSRYSSKGGKNNTGKKSNYSNGFNNNPGRSYQSTRNQGSHTGGSGSPSRSSGSGGGSYSGKRPR